MKTKQLLLSLITLGAFSGLIYAGGATETTGNLKASAKIAAEDTPAQEMKVKKEYDFTFNSSKTGVELTCSDVSVDVNGTACRESNYEGYEGLLFQTPFSFREKGLCYLGASTATWGVNNLKPGYKVTLVVGYTGAGGLNLVDNGVGTQVYGKAPNESLSNDTLVYNIDKEGILAFTIGKWSTYWCKLTSLKVEAPKEYSTTYIDFNAWAGDGLTIDASQKVGTAWEIGNARYQDIYQCTTAGLERFAFQAVTDGTGKGYWIRPGKGGLFDFNATRSMALLNLKAGTTVTMNSTGLIDFTGGGAGDGEWTVDNSTANLYVVSMTADGNLGMCVDKNIYMKDIKIVEEKSGVETPSISAVGNPDEVNTVTITCKTEGAQIYYTIDDSEEAVLYEGPFTVSKSCTISAYALSDGDKSDKMSIVVVAGYVTKPTATITAVNGINRTVTFASATADAVVEISMDGENYVSYTEPIVISDTTAVWSVAKKNDFVSDTLVASMAAGTEISLNAPVFAKVSYDEETQKSVYTITSNAAGVLCSPAVSLTYTLPDGTTVKCENGAEVEVASLGKLSAVAEAEGYLSASSYIWIKAPSVLAVEWKIDFDTIAMITGGVNPVFLSELHEINGSNFQQMSIGDSIIPNVMVAQGTNWLCRIMSEVPRGLYQYNSGNRNMAISGLKRNQVVKIHTDNLTAGTAASSMTMVDTGTAVQDVNLTDADTLVFRMIAPGALVLNCTRYYYTHAVSVYSDPNVTKDVEYSIVKCDGVKRYVEITCATPGSEIFYRTGTPSTETVTDEDGNETVVDTTVFGEYSKYTQPVEISETTCIGAYGTYQDVDSDEVTATFEAGYTVALNEPVIKFVESEDTSVKVFEITVDNSKVIASPVADIYYTVPGQESKLYEGPVSVPASVVGWMSASASYEGYATSKDARRYLDSRTSYTESYVAIDENTSVMPSSIGDMEIDYSNNINVEQSAAAVAAGRVYLHRVAKNGTIHIVLPFAMTTGAFTNGDVKVTDAKGNSLVRGEDFTVYKLENSENPVQSVHTGNLVANTNAYVVKVKDELFDEEIIFVSATNITLGINQTTFTQPSTGYQVKTNRRLVPVVLDIPAYILNEKGDAYELVVPDAEAGVYPVIAPYQACILADESICSDPSKAKIEIDLSLGIKTLNSGVKSVKSVKYFNLSGIEISSPENGIVIRQTVYSDGTQKTDKLNIK